MTLAKHSAPQLGVIQSITGGECSIRLRGRKDALVTKLATVALVTVDRAEHKEKMSKIGSPMTHFITLEIKGWQAIEKIKKLQHDLEEVEGIGKPAKEHQLHITIGVLNIPEEDMDEVERKFHKILEV